MPYLNTEWTPSTAARLRDYLARPGYEIPAGLGTDDAACSIAAINLALNGHLNDRVPSCMSYVTGVWIRGIQDVMPPDIRNHPRWRGFLPLAAGTGREHERERTVIISDWAWDDVLSLLQPIADDNCCGDAWRKMREWRSVTEASRMAADARADGLTALADAATVSADMADSCTSSRLVANAVEVSVTVANSLAWSGETCSFASTTFSDAWQKIDPIDVLRRLIDVPN